MGRIQQTFSELKNSNKKALIGYIVSGDPDISSTLNAMHLMVEGGVHVIELGIAFSDPMAEGFSIQRGHERALLSKISLQDTLSLVGTFREKDNKTPIILMGYMNTFEALGSKIFSSTAKENGVDGILIVDMSLEESKGFTEETKKLGIDVIRLVAPTTSKSRIKKICSEASGYIYYISLKGITGANSINVEEVSTKVGVLRKMTTLPVVIGFGIKDGKTASYVKDLSDGIVVGSVLVDIMGGKKDEIEKELSIKIKDLSQALSMS
jgi:tryptophan synthase alpha chain